MITIIRGRDSGKARELLEAARDLDACILTLDKRAFQVKAQAYGYDDITIIDTEDLLNHNYDPSQDILLHQGDKLLKWLFGYFYGLNVCGFSATEGE